MQDAMTANDAIREISVNPQPSGLRAVYLVETRSRQEAREVDELFDEVESRLQVRCLSEGKLMSYVVQADESDTGFLDEIDDLLRSKYSFVVTQRSFDDLIHGIVNDLAADTDSHLIDVPHCNICGRAEPFPTTVVNMADEDGSVIASGCYCGRCTAEASAPTNKQFVRSLLEADERDFGIIGKAELVRRHSPTRPVRFKIRSRQPV